MYTAIKTLRSACQAYNLCVRGKLNIICTIQYSQIGKNIFSTRQCSALVCSFSSSTYEQAAAAIHTHSADAICTRCSAYHYDCLLEFCPKNNFGTNWGQILKKHQTDLYFLELCHQMTNDCLLISGFLPVFDCFCVLGT